jgi:transcriptional regulator NrdR family protein
MVCERCRATEKHLHNIGDKEHYKHGNYRTYVCDECDHRFQTIETNQANNKMTCEKCGGQDDKFHWLPNKKHTDEGNVRKYICGGCGNLITTIEKYNTSLKTLKPAKDYSLIKQKLVI